MREQSFHLKPGANRRSSGPLLVSFPGEPGRYLNPEGETVVVTDPKRKLYWLRAIRDGDVVQVKASQAKGGKWLKAPPELQDTRHFEVGVADEKKGRK